MMKKNGFTLAEVLITLSIIGVIATLTIPALITNIGEQQYLAGIKKGMNTLAEAAQLNKVMLGFDYADLNTTTSSIDESTYSLYSLLGLRTNIDTKPKEQEDGTVDFQNIDWFEMVQAGQKLAYYHEAHFGDTVTVYRADAGDGIYYFRTVKGDTVCLEAMVRTAARESKGE